MEATRVVTAWDFDGTLSTRDNVVPFLRYAVGNGTLARAVSATAPRIAFAALRDAQRNAAKAALLRRVFAGYDVARFEQQARDFAAIVIAKFLRNEAVERAAWHREQGHELVIVSASLRSYLDPIAEHLGFDAVLATELAVGDDGRLTGELRGANVRRAEKARRLDEWLAETGSDAYVWAYGDSNGDRELFERADQSIRVGRRVRRWPARWS
jgi:phosphatidylglycerophosphatase C